MSMSALRVARASASCARAMSMRTPAAGVARIAMRASHPAQVQVQVQRRALSGTSAVRGEGANDVLLAKKLQEEIEYESETAALVADAKDAAEPEFLRTFRQQGVWRIEDTPGQDEVVLTRKFGNETVRMIFTVADVRSADEDVDEDGEGEGASAEGEEGEEGEEEESGAAQPIRASFSITKSSGPGALCIDTMVHEGAFIVDNVAFYKDAKTGTELTIESDWKRRGVYGGPEFDTLDIGVQEEFDNYMHERGINDALAWFAVEYAEYKEQKEYVQWLKNVKSFIEL